MPWSLETHLARYEARDRRLILKWSALYAEKFKQRVFGDTGASTTTGEEILALTLDRIVQGGGDYAFRDGDILLFYFLCRCCRTTVLELHKETGAQMPAPAEEHEDAAYVLTEQAALQYLERRQALHEFLAFAGSQKLRGKVRGYAGSFHLYAAGKWDEQQIAKSLRVKPADVARFRSRLRELIEDFELQRMRERRA
jgi:hypothetical protein